MSIKLVLLIKLYQTSLGFFVNLTVEMLLKFRPTWYLYLAKISNLALV